MLKSKLAGLFKLQLIDDKGVIRETRDWQPNLVTNYALDCMFKDPQSSLMIMLGSGTTPPQHTDKRMEALTWLKVSGSPRVNKFDGHIETDGSDNVTAVYDYEQHVTRFFNHTGADKTLSEIGLGRVLFWYDKPNPSDRTDENRQNQWASPTDYNNNEDAWPFVDTNTQYQGYWNYETRVHTHALIKDNSGAPAPITLPDGWYLDVTYEIRQYLSLDEPTGTVPLTVNGTPTDFSYKASVRHRDPNQPKTQYNYRRAVSFLDTQYGLILTSAAPYISRTNYPNQFRIYQHPMDGTERWQFPDQLSGRGNGTTDTNTQIGISSDPWTEPYTEGTYKRKFKMYSPLHQLNKFAPETIKSVLVATTIGHWLIDYDDGTGEGIPKDETREMELEFQLGVEHYTGPLNARP